MSNWVENCLHLNAETLYVWKELNAAAKSPKGKNKPEANMADETKLVDLEQDDDHSQMAEEIAPVIMWCSKDPTDNVEVYETSLEVEPSSCKFKEKTILESTVEHSMPVVQRQAPKGIIQNSSYFEPSSSIEETLVMHCEDVTDEVEQEKVDDGETSNDYGNIDVDITPDCIIQDDMIHGEKVKVEEKCPSFIIEAVSSQAFVENGSSLCQDVSAACQESQENIYFGIFEGNTDNCHETRVKVDIGDDDHLSQNSEEQKAVTNYLMSDADNENVSFNKSGRNLNHKCTLCNRQFAWVSNLRRHMYKHTDKRPHKCTFCHKTFKTVASKNLHMKNNHASALKDWSFNRPDRKLNHKCAVCNKEFSRTTNLRRHMLTHTEERPHQCTFCPRAFKTVYDRNMHLKIHCTIAFKGQSLNGPERKLNHKCTVCNKEFSRTTNLRRHMFTHTEERPHQCTFCPRAFKTVFDMNLHIKIFHPIVLKRAEADNCHETVAEVDISDDNRLSENSEGQEAVVTNYLVSDADNEKLSFNKFGRNLNHKCTVCDKRFGWMSNLRRHMFTHTDERPHECTFCHRKFKREYVMKMHMKVHKEIGGGQSLASIDKDMDECSSLGSTDKDMNECSSLGSTDKDIDECSRKHLGSTDKDMDECSRKHLGSTDKDIDDYSRKSLDLMDKGIDDCLNKECYVLLSKTESLHGRYLKKLENRTCDRADVKRTSVSPKQKKLISYLVMENGTQRGDKSGCDNPTKTKLVTKACKCCICNKLFNSTSNLGQHLIIHTDQKLCKCNGCNKQFNSLVNLNRHMMINHVKLKPFRCSMCSKVFKSSLCLKIHIKLQHVEEVNVKSMEDGRCKGTEGGNISDPQRHIASHNLENPFECTLCDKTFKVVYDLKTHMKCHEPFEPKDSQPSVTVMMDTNWEKDEHNESEEHPNEDFDSPMLMSNKSHENLKLTSQMPSNKSEHNDGFTETEDMDLPDSQVPACEDKWQKNSANKPLSHSGTADSNDNVNHKKILILSCIVDGKRKFMCSRCGRKFPKAFSARRHIVLHYPERPYKCTLCAKDFKVVYDLNTHMKGHLDTDKESFIDTDELESNKKSDEKKTCVKCLYCGKSFCSISNLRRHMLMHSGDKTPYSCTKCGKTFKLFYNLHKHLEKHSQDDIYVSDMENDQKSGLVCSICGKVFPRKFGLKRHMASHSMVKPHQCLVCKKSFRVIYNLNTHMRLHCEDMEFSCHVCQKIFPNVRGLKKHLNTHGKKKYTKCPVSDMETHAEMTENCHNHKPNEQPFLCSVCGLTFEVKSSLTKHILRHAAGEEKLWECFMCGSIFDKRFKLKKHMKEHDDGNEISIEDDELNYLTEDKSSSSNDKVYKCRVCDQKFQGSDNLLRHSLIHCDMEQLKCMDCDKAEVHEISLERHYLIEHVRIVPFRCAFCTKMFRSLNDFKVHLKVHKSLNEHINWDSTNASPFSSGLKFANESLENEKMANQIECDENVESGDHLLQESKILFKCCLCNYDNELAGKSNLRKHMLIHCDYETLGCKGCGKIASNKSNLKRHAVMDHSKMIPVNCSRCFEFLENETDYERHMKCQGAVESSNADASSSQVDLDSSDMTPSLCGPEPVNLMDGEGKADYTEFHGVRESDKDYVQESSPIIDNQLYKCRVCKDNIIFQGKLNVRNHMSIHCNFELLRCRICGKTTTYSSSLKRHMMMAHVKMVPDVQTLNQIKLDGLEPPDTVVMNKCSSVCQIKTCQDDIVYICCICNDGKRFEGKGNIRKHVSTHCDFEHLQCLGCGHVLSNRSNAMRHMMDIHIKRVPSKCTECLKVFKSITDLNSHMKGHKALNLLRSDFNCNEPSGSQRDLIVKDFDSTDNNGEVSFNPKVKVLLPDSCDSECVNVIDDVTMTKEIKSNEIDVKLDGLELPDAVVMNERSSVCQIKTWQDDIVYICCICNDGKRFGGKGNIRKHVSTHCDFEHLQCLGCGHVLSNRSNAMRHMMDIHIKRVPSKCTECLKVFKSITDLNSHMKGHKALNVLRSDFNCNEPSGSQRDLIVKDFDSTDNNGEVSFNPKVKVLLPDSCDSECVNVIDDVTMTKEIKSNEIDVKLDGLELPDAVVMNEHSSVCQIKTWQDDIVYICCICNDGKRFGGKGNIRKHVSTHCDFEHLKCLGCGHVLSNRSNAMRHMMDIHIKRISSKYSECLKVFKSITDLNSHMKGHKSLNRLRSDFNCNEPSGSQRDVIVKDFDSTDNNGEVSFNPTVKVVLPDSCDSECVNVIGDITMTKEMESNEIDDATVDDSENLSFTCCICNSGKRLKGKKDVSKHVSIHCDLEQNKCIKCDKSWNFRSRLKRHMIVTHLKMIPVKCVLCCEILENLPAFERHMNVHKKVQELERGVFIDDQLYKCCICADDNIFEGKMNVRNHMLIHCNFELLRCLECGKRATNKSNVKRHMMLAHVKMVPQGFQTLNQKEIDRDRESGNLTLDGDDRESGNLTLDGDDRESGYLTLDGDDRESGNLTLDGDDRESGNLTLGGDDRESGNLNESSPVNDQLFECLICKDEFKSRRSLENHMSIHCDFDKLTCKKCGIMFTSKSSGKKHMVMIHTKVVGGMEEPRNWNEFKPKNEDRLFECCICENGIKYEGRVCIKDHMFLTHFDVSSLRCVKCDKMFVNPLGLTQHMSFHVMVIPLRCTECDEIFDTKTELNNHMMRVHNDHMEENVTNLCKE